jgi:hypothetical protein
VCVGDGGFSSRKTALKWWEDDVTGFYTFTVSKVQTDKSLVAGSGANESSHSQSQSSEKRKKRIQIKFKKKNEISFFSTDSFLLSNKTFPDQRLRKKEVVCARTNAPSVCPSNLIILQSICRVVWVHSAHLSRQLVGTDGDRHENGRIFFFLFYSGEKRRGRINSNIRLTITVFSFTFFSSKATFAHTHTQVCNSFLKVIRLHT